MIQSRLLSSKVNPRSIFTVLRKYSDQLSLQASVASARATECRDESSSLQQLPVQPLNVTLEKFLRSVKPLLNEYEFSTTETLVKNFSAKAGIGYKLQKILEDRSAKRLNWLEEWWLNTAYLEYRNPVVVYSSPGLVWPEQNFKCQGDQLQFTAGLIACALEFNSALDQRKVPQESMGKVPLDMQQYYKIFGTTRIPKPKRDELSYQDPSFPFNTIVVVYNNHFYSVPVYEMKKGVRVPLNETQIYGQLQDIVTRSPSAGVPIGVLTSNDRDSWAEAYKKLQENPINARSLRAIEKSLFVVCIDQPLPAFCAPNQQSKTSALLLHGGGGSRGNAGNRWYDKTVQFVIGSGSDGVGLTYEHSPAEGGPIGVMTDYVVSHLESKLNFKPPVTFPKPEELKFEVNEDIQCDIDRAVAAIDKIALDLDIWGFTFNNFGKSTLKSLKVSPDSFIQLAIQLAFYKVHREPGAQYESGSLRKFVGGRTDTIRTCSEESLKFCEAMTINEMPKEDKAKALATAINTHKRWVSEVIDGKGVDRHLLGLKLAALENKLDVPKLYSDQGYIKSTNFRLSTSNVPSKCDGFMIYGPIVDDGYACCYNPRDSTINFGTTAWKTCSVTKLQSFKEALEQSLVEMKDVLSAEPIAVKSKL